MFINWRITRLKIVYYIWKSIVSWKYVWKSNLKENFINFSSIWLCFKFHWLHSQWIKILIKIIFGIYVETYFQNNQCNIRNFNLKISTLYNSIINLEFFYFRCKSSVLKIWNVKDIENDDCPKGIIYRSFNYAHRLSQIYSLRTIVSYILQRIFFAWIWCHYVINIILRLTCDTKLNILFLCRTILLCIISTIMQS